MIASIRYKNGANIPAGKSRQLMSVTIVVALACCIAVLLHRTPPTYEDRVDIIFSLPRDQTAPNAYYIYATSLITTEQATVQIMASPLGQRQIRTAGGTAAVSMQLSNLYNQEYPEYSEPLAMLTSTSTSPAQARRSLVIAMRLLRLGLARRQAQSGVPPPSRIVADALADSGAVPQHGSPSRGLAGLTVLTLVGAAASWQVAGRRQATRGNRGTRPRARHSSAPPG
jgi:hypothetical protein